VTPTRPDTSFNDSITADCTDKYYLVAKLPNFMCKSFNTGAETTKHFNEKYCKASKFSTILSKW